MYLGKITFSFELTRLLAFSSLFFSSLQNILCTNKKGADHPALLHRLIDTFIVHFLDPTAAIRSRLKLSILKPVYVAVQVDE